MRKLTSLIVCLVLCFHVSVAWAQNNQRGNAGNTIVVDQGEKVEYARTGTTNQPLQRGEVQAKYLRGLGRYNRDTGKAIERIGVYNNLQQEAYRRALDNWDQRIRQNWERDDIYQSRKNRSKRSWIEREKHRLDMAEARHALKLREADLIKRGVLPTKPKKSITIRGVKYNSVAEWRKTYDWNLHHLEMHEKEILRKIAKAKDECQSHQSIAFLAYWDNLSYVGRQRYAIMRSGASPIPSYASTVPCPPEIEEKIKGHRAELSMLYRVRTMIRELQARDE